MSTAATGNYEQLDSSPAGDELDSSCSVGDGTLAGIRDTVQDSDPCEAPRWFENEVYERLTHPCFFSARAGAEMAVSPFVVAVGGVARVTLGVQMDPRSLLQLRHCLTTTCCVSGMPCAQRVAGDCVFNCGSVVV